MRGPSRQEDTKNISLITGATAVALIATVALIANSAPSPVDIGIAVPTPAFAASVSWIEGPALDDRLYGEVVTRSGESYVGYLRWDRNEGAWTDLLDATKEGRSQSLSGIRFGHVSRIEVLDSRSALFTLRSGQDQMFSGRASDLGSGLRSLQVEDEARGIVELSWDELREVGFEAAPDGSRPRGERLYGTMTTRSGEQFTGYVTWDVDEIYTTDVLDGDIDGRDQEIPFGALASIERKDSRSARVRLTSGEVFVMSGSNDVDSSNRGIAIADVTLGHVKVDWREFAGVEFSTPPAPIGYEQFDGGTPLYGVVTLVSGDQVEGRVVWDNDEAYSWEMLNGESRGAEFHVEFENISTMERNRRGVMVELHDGRTYELSGSNDVDRGNRGVFVIDASGNTHRIEWEAFDSVRFSDK